MHKYETIRVIEAEMPDTKLTYFTVEACKKCNSVLYQILWAEKDDVDFNKSMGEEGHLTLYNSYWCGKCDLWYQLSGPDNKPFHDDVYKIY